MADETSLADNASMTDETSLPDDASPGDQGGGAEPVSGATEARVAVDHLGGIEHCEVTLPRGVTVLSGENATNRTSLLRAIAGALGGSMTSLKTDADQGEVELTLDGSTFTRAYSRAGSTVSTDGAPLTEHSELVDVFGMLTADNPVRQAVRQQADVRELLMRPVDTRAINQEIQRVSREREQAERRLEEIDRQEEQLPDLERRRERLANDLEDVEADLIAVEETIEAAEATEDEVERAEELRDELETHRDDLASVEEKLEYQESELAARREEREDVVADREDLSVPEEDLAEISQEIDQLQRRKQEVRDTIGDLTALVDANETLLDAEPRELPGITVESEPAAELDPMSQAIECWTCGSRVERQAIADRLESLRDELATLREQRSEIEADIDDLQTDRRDLQATADRVQTLETRREELDRDIGRREEEVAELRGDQEALEAEIAAIEQRIDETAELRDSDLMEAHQQQSELEYKRGRLESQLDDVEGEIAEMETASEDREEVKAEYEALTEELEALRTRIEDLEQAIVEQFNTHMERVLELLDLDRLARVWLERKVPANEQGDATFDLHIVRETADGTVYEDTIGHLSESEREVVGLIVALAGYLVHEVHETVPFILLDSIEAIDAGRLRRLVEYLAEHVPFLVVAVLPEVSPELPDEYVRIEGAELV